MTEHWQPQRLHAKLRHAAVEADGDSDWLCVGCMCARWASHSATEVPDIVESFNRAAEAELATRCPARWPVMQHSRASRRHCLCKALCARRGPTGQHFAAAAWRQDIIQMQCRRKLRGSLEAPWLASEQPAELHRSDALLGVPAGTRRLTGSLRARCKLESCKLPAVAALPLGSLA